MTATQTLTWSKSYGGGRFTFVGNHKIVELPAWRVSARTTFPPFYLVERCVNLLPVTNVGAFDTLEEALEATQQ